jgi:predicted dithiol-disulfide oxidoreductase (DUF899 family)
MNTANADAGTAGTIAPNHPVVPADRWVAEPRRCSAREGARALRDEIARARRALPWERVARTTSSTRPRAGARSRSVRRPAPAAGQHFMLGAGCGRLPSCSFMADHTDGMTVHLAHRDVVRRVSRAPLAEIERFKQRMGWQFRWVSSSANDFNKDFHVSFDPKIVSTARSTTTTA